MICSFKDNILLALAILTLINVSANGTIAVAIELKDDIMILKELIMFY